MDLIFFLKNLGEILTFLLENNMLLNDKIICDYVKKYAMIDPFVNHKVKAGLSYGLEPSGYTLTLDNVFKKLRKDIDMTQICIDPLEDHSRLYETFTVSENQEQVFFLAPFESCLAQVREYIRLPKNVAADIWGKSSYLRCHIIPHLALIEPGWEGKLTVELSNLNNAWGKLYIGLGLIQIRFYLLEQPKSVYDGYYQSLEEPVLCQARI